jgi:hypothetical protein
MRCDSLIKLRQIHGEQFELNKVITPNNLK